MSSTDPWGDRLVDTQYIKMVFQPINVLLLVLFFMVVYGSKYMFAIPMVLSDIFYKKTNKKLRTEAKSKQRAERAARRAARQRGGAPGADVELADIDVSGAADSADADQQDLLARAREPVKVVETGAYNRSDGIQWLEHELVSNDNPAVAVSYTSFVIAICIVMTGPRTPVDVEAEPFNLMFETIGWSALGILMLGLANIFNTRVILFGILKQRSILEANMATAMVEAGGYIASSFIIRASLTGDSSDSDFWPALAACCIYFVVGQLLLLLSVGILQVMTKYDDQVEAGKGNVAAGVKFFGNLVSMGWIISNPVTKTDSILAYFLFFIFGSILQTLLRLFLDRAVIPGHKIDEEIEKDQNWGVAGIEATITISLAFVMGSFLPDISCAVVPIAS